tara:strand:- start:24829 stop:25560 length:732 start_codon:yes stop_codon:yes gene_type:complete
MKVLILGHKGMLGHMVYKYLSTKGDCKVVTTDLRWPTREFKDFVTDFWWSENGGYIINCIGAIHQRTNDFDVNVDLPIWLDENIGCYIIHPGTDCEIDDDDYGNSKRKAAEYILEDGRMTKIIKTSIIGPELNTEASLLEWFLNVEDDSIGGYSECYWNGNTTLQWAKVAYDMMSNWDNYKDLNIPATECISKYELLNIMKDVYGKDVEINKNDSLKIDKCLVPTIETPNIKIQLEEIKEFNK